ncbi:hypothetical protein AMST5_01294 [freshwater sediment metagenome]|uniref:DNA primase/polymerase bifunctional N-terminal domain-containing protein n=1 Tax=freshwater sediment metagenome TaxID=556182 RepID=A0AA48M2A5_9ZZZZ
MYANRYEKNQEKILENFSENSTTGPWDPNEIFDWRDYPTLTLVQRKPTNQSVAMRLAQAGFCIFPCGADKKPLGGVRWRDESTCDQAQIARWRNRWPNAVPAIDMGKSGLIVIDCDRHGGPDGVAALESLIDEHGLLDYGPVIHTPSDGLHLYFRQPSDGKPLGNSKGALPPGIDVRGVGGYVIASGATLPDGRQWSGVDGMDDIDDAFELDNIPEPPAWLVDMIRAPKQRDETAPRETRQQPSIARYDASDAGARAWAAKALDGKADDLAGTPHGGRDNALNASSYAMGTMIARGWIGQEEVVAAFEEASRANGFTKEEGARKVRDKIIRAIRDGMANPHADLADRDREEAEKFAPWLERINRMVDEAFPNESPKITLGDDGTLYDSETGEIVGVDKETEEPVLGDDFATMILARRGLVSDVAKWIIHTSLAPRPRLAVASALAIVAALSSRQMVTPTNANLNLYVLMIAKTGAGKDTSIGAPANVLSETELSSILGPGRFQSEVYVYDTLIVKPVCIVSTDEIGSYFAAITGRNAQSHFAQILSAFRIAYGGGIIPTPGSRIHPSVLIHRPCLTLLGASTPEQFYSSIGNAQLEDGTLNRFIAVTSLESVEKRYDFDSRQPVPKELKQRLLALADRPGNQDPWRFRMTPPDDSFKPGDPYVVPWTNEAKEAWIDFDREIGRRMEADAHIAKFAVRCAENAIRVATVLAVSENIGRPMVRPEHIAMGRAMVESSLRDMVRGYDEHGEATKGFRLREKILEAIGRKKGGVIARTALYHAVERISEGQAAFGDAINFLTNMGAIEEVEPPASQKAKRGKKAELYRLRPRR